MKSVFADTLYWIAVAKPGDPWHEAAQTARRQLGTALIVTTEEVLAEFLTAMSAGGPESRRRAVRTVRAVMMNSGVVVVPQSHDGFLKAVDRYEARGDKAYSVTDCSSMNVMDEQQITAVLTNDHHFAQEGFRVLIQTRG